MAIESDPFDSLLGLENQFYNEGYDLGVSDGNRAGLIEGRSFGIVKGFEKYVSMGRLQGKAMVWAGRLPGSHGRHDNDLQENHDAGTRRTHEEISVPGSRAKSAHDPPREALQRKDVPTLPANSRLEMHIRTLYALAEPGSLSTENSEESVSDFDDRLKRAKGKIKIIEKLIGETDMDEAHKSIFTAHEALSKREDDNIEDISSLRARH